MKRALMFSPLLFLFLLSSEVDAQTVCDYPDCVRMDDGTIAVKALAPLEYYMVIPKHRSTRRHRAPMPPLGWHIECWCPYTGKGGSYGPILYYPWGGLELERPILTAEVAPRVVEKE